MRIQLETASAVADVDAFGSIEGVDCLFVGPADLAKSLGHRGDFRKPEVMQVLEETVERIAVKNKPAGMTVKQDDVKHWLCKGVTFLYCHLNDYALIRASSFYARRRASMRHAFPIGRFERAAVKLWFVEISGPKWLSSMSLSPLPARSVVELSRQGTNSREWWRLLDARAKHCGVIAAKRA